MSKNLTQLIVLLLTISLSSCTTFRETHYFKDSLEPIANYYKVDINGYSFWSSSRYVSGYYDRNAIQEYFGEIEQPAKARFVPVGTNSTIDPNKELVLLLSSNSDAIANGFSNLVKNKTTINSIALLANKQKIDDAAKIKSNLSSIENKITLFKMRTAANLLTDATDLSDAQIKQRYLQFVKSELAQMYPGVETPNNLKDLYKWLLIKKD
jgi:hypothetical protein